MNQIYNINTDNGLHWVPIIDIGIAKNSDAYLVNFSYKIYSINSKFFHFFHF